jgi:hypothetical protein
MAKYCCAALTVGKLIALSWPTSRPRALLEQETYALSSQKFIRAAAIRYLKPGLGRVRNRQLVNAGHYGPRYLLKGADKGALLRLDLVLKTLGITEEQLAPGLSEYAAAHKQSLPPIIEVDPADLVEIGGGK